MTAHDHLRRYAEFAIYLSMFGVLVILCSVPVILLSGYFFLVYMWAATVGEAFALGALHAALCFLVTPFAAFTLYRGLGGQGFFGLVLPGLLCAAELVIWGFFIIPLIVAYAVP